MGDEDSAASAGDHSEDLKRWLTIGNSVGLLLVIFVMTISTFLVVDLRGSVAALEDQARKAAKAAKALQEELENVKEKLDAAETALAKSAELRATNIDAADTANDCVIRPGDKNGVANCIQPEPGH